jgi:tetratricopeptide (TPR) repeat protein
MWVFLHMRKILFIVFLTTFYACNNNQDQPVQPKANDPYPSYVTGLLKEIDRFPDSAELRVQLVDTMDSLNLTKDALSQIDSLIARDPGNYGIWFRKGELAIKMADTALAILSFSSAEKIYSNPDVVLTIANLYAAQKNKLALELCNRIIAQKPDRTYIAHSYYIMGLYEGNIGNTKIAIDNFNYCIQNNYFYIDAYMEIGWIYFDQQKFEKAKGVFETAVAVKPTEAAPHYWKAKCDEKLAQPQEALNAYQLALNLDNSLSEAAEAISRIKASKK